MGILGASYQLIPIVLDRPLWSERLARVQWGVLLVGVVGMVAHFLAGNTAGAPGGGRPGRLGRRHASGQRGRLSSRPPAVDPDRAPRGSGPGGPGSHRGVQTRLGLEPRGLRVFVGAVPGSPRSCPPGPRLVDCAHAPGRLGARLSDVPRGSRALPGARAAPALGIGGRHPAARCRPDRGAATRRSRRAGSVRRRRRPRRQHLLDGPRAQAAEPRLGAQVRSHRERLSCPRGGGRPRLGARSRVGSPGRVGLCRPPARRLDLAVHRRHGAENRTLPGLVSRLRTLGRHEGRSRSRRSRVARSRGGGVGAPHRRLPLARRRGSGGQRSLDLGVGRVDRPGRVRLRREPGSCARASPGSRAGGRERRPALHGQEDGAQGAHTQ